MSPDSIQAIRQSLKLTQQQLAEKLGVKRNTLARWELKSGKFPITPTAEKLLRAISQ